MSEERVNEFLDSYLDAYRLDLDVFLRATGSPIERLYVASLLADNGALGADTPSDMTETIGARGVCFRSPAARLWCHISAGYIERNPARMDLPAAPAAMLIGDVASYMVPQYPLSVGGRNIVIDVAMIPVAGRKGSPFAIELDGHDFHERTKEQAAKDKSRDRLLQTAGWKTLRFTGSEVFKSPFKCAVETHQAMFWDEVRSNPAFAEVVRAGAARVVAMFEKFIQSGGKAW